MKKAISINIIGSGIGGLFCGALLAKHGFKVNIFEARLKIGGYATSWKRKDFLFDSSLHEFTGFYPDRKKVGAFKFLDLFNKIKFIDIPSPYTSVFDDFEFKVPHDYEKFKNKLIETFPEEKKNIISVLDKIKNISLNVAEYAYDRDNLKKNLKSIIKYRHIIMNVFNTAYDIIWKKIKTPKLRTIIGQIYIYYSDNIKKLNAVFFSAPTFSYLTSSLWISGTSSKFSDALKEIIEKNGGKIYTHAKATKINFENKKAVSITINNSDNYASDITICNSPLKHTVSDLIDKKDFPFLLRQKALKTKPSTSLFSLYIGLKTKAANIGITDFCYTINALDDILDTNKKGELVEHSKRTITLASFHLDDSLCPPDKNVLNICILDNIKHWEKYKENKEEYKKEKNRIAEIILERVEKRFPGFKKNIEIMEIGTPLTMEKYTNNTDGAVYGACQRISQGTVFRFPNEIKNRNLYFCSAWTAPGGGFAGSIYSAINTASSILSKFETHDKMTDYIEPELKEETFKNLFK